MSEMINGRYELIHQLGQGGYGAVYEAYDHMLSRHVALKQLHALNFGDQIKDRFLEEARISSQLTHPSALMIFDFGLNEHGDPYLVSELLNGVSLQDYLRNEPCTPAQTLGLMIEVGEALFEAHELGIIHRDLKPANLFVHLSPSKMSSRETVVKLLDFGIAKVIQEEGGGATKSGAIVGTPAFMAPEQIKDSSKVSARCDQYSLGLVGWSALHGRPPFKGGNEFELMHKQVNEPLPPLELEGAHVHALFEVISRLASKEPMERYENMGEVIEALVKLRGEYKELSQGSNLRLKEGAYHLAQRSKSYSGRSTSLNFSSLKRGEKPSAPSATMQQVGFESSMVTLDATFADRSVDRDLDETLLPEELANSRTEQATRLSPQPTPDTALYEQRDALNSGDQPQQAELDHSHPISPALNDFEEPHFQDLVQGEEEEKQEKLGSRRSSFANRNRLLIVMGAMCLIVFVWWLSHHPTRESINPNMMHSSPLRPRLGGPQQSQVNIPLYRVALSPQPSTLGYPIGAELEVLVEDRLGKPVLDFELRTLPSCLTSIADPLRLLFKVVSNDCGLLVLSVNGQEVSTNIQAQGLIDDVLQDIK